MGTMHDLGLIFFLSIGSGFLSALVGLGGGLLLLGVIPLFVPMTAVIPIQGVVNLSSNLSRFVLTVKQARLDWFYPYALGGLLGTVLGYPLIGVLSEQYLAIMLALFILASVWTNVLKLIGRWLQSTVLMAAVQGFLALFVGSVAALSIPLLQARKMTLKAVVATSAMQMSLLNTFRVAAFYMAGFAYGDYSQILLTFIMGVMAGTYFGTLLQPFVPERLGQWLLKSITTVLAVVLLWGAF
ncbi:MAG: TSUP family transporter [Neisseriaceae bacterium]|nr:TSUP family transporter [Neisseriaceae bacterium]MBP6861000.1 TSUP family transporter [Neisseriaceae bacterium]